MKKIIIIILTLAFLASSCRTTKDNDIHVNHAKEKDHYKKPSEKKYHKKNTAFRTNSFPSTG